MAEGVIPSEADYSRIVRAVGVVERQRKGFFGEVPWGRKPVGSAACEDRNEIQVWTLFGDPTGGNLTLDITVNGITDTVTVAYNATSSALKTALETHDEIAVDDVEVLGGPWPDVAMSVEYKGNLEATRIRLPIASVAGLTATDPVSMIAVVDTPGYPNA